MASETNPFENVAKMIQQFKVPGLDMAPIIESRRKDVEALVEANKATYGAIQALAAKQTEILSQAMQGIQDSAKGLATGSAFAPDPVKQAELVRSAYEKALSDMKDLAEIGRKAQVDATAAITARAAQSMAELKKLTQQK